MKRKHRDFETLLADSLKDAALPDSGFEKTVGINFGRVSGPRIHGPAVLDFKRTMGVCLADGCKKIALHEGDHT